MGERGQVAGYFPRRPGMSLAWIDGMQAVSRFVVPAMRYRVRRAPAPDGAAREGARGVGFAECDCSQVECARGACPMILSELTSYLAERKRAALIDLSYHFGSDPEALRFMLSTLERKGRVRKLPMGTTCGGGCTKCDPASIEIYEWVERDSD